MKSLMATISSDQFFYFSFFFSLLWFLAPGSSPDMTYVDAPLTTVPPEASYEEDWEVFDP